MLKIILKLSLFFITYFLVSLTQAENYTKIKYVCLSSAQAKAILMLNADNLHVNDINDVMYYPYLKSISLSKSSGLGIGVGDTKDTLWHYSYDELESGEKVGVYDVLYRDKAIVLVTYHNIKGDPTVIFSQQLRNTSKHKINQLLAKTSRECI